VLGHVLLFALNGVQVFRRGLMGAGKTHVQFLYGLEDSSVRLHKTAIRHTKTVFKTKQDA
jgi:hypothetical protein